MDKNILENIYGNFNYKSCKFIKNTELIGIYLLSLLTMNIAPFNILIFLILCLETYKYSPENYSKEVLELKGLYNEFIKRYAKLNKMFELNNPIEIYNLYYKLLKRGYFCNKTFNFNDYNTEEINNLLGINILNGSGLCRHISTMLSDVYKELDMNSEVLPVRMVDNVNDKFNLVGNHIINLVEKDGISYFLDPMNDVIWNKEDKRRIITTFKDKEEYANICNLLNPFSFFCLDFNKINNIKNMLSNPSFNSDEINNLKLADINKIYLDNLDIFWDFKDENKEIYNEVENNILKIKKKIK